MKRVATVELLDTDCGTPAEVSGSLADLQMINRWFGGISTTEDLVRRAAQTSRLTSLSVLEIAAGTGYVPEMTRRRLQSDELNIAITLLDRIPFHLRNGSHAVGGDALALPFRDASFDLLSCTLFAHHLSPQELVSFVDGALRVCRVAVLINDLVRHPLHLALVYAGLPFYRSRLTRHDAPASVRQAYTPEEMRSLLAQTRAARVEIHRHYLFRMGVMVWKE